MDPPSGGGGSPCCAKLCAGHPGGLGHDFGAPAMAPLVSRLAFRRDPAGGVPAESRPLSPPWSRRCGGLCPYQCVWERHVVVHRWALIIPLAIVINSLSHPHLPQPHYQPKGGCVGTPTKSDPLAPLGGEAVVPRAGPSPGQEAHRGADIRSVREVGLRRDEVPDTGPSWAPSGNQPGQGALESDA